MQVTVTRLEASAACSAPWPTERFRLDVLTTVVDTGFRDRWAHLPPVEDGAPVVVLLCGGDKGNQKRDIKRAKSLAEDWR